MIKQSQVASSYPVHLPYTRAELISERAALQLSGADPVRLADIDDILVEVDEGLIILMDEV